jgi:predicted peroxiredoxin
MKKYLLIESRGEHEAVTATHYFDLAKALKARGDSVEIVLVQSGVTAARAGARGDALSSAIQAGIGIFADEFALRERALSPASLTEGVAATSLARVIDRMADGWNVLWH